MIIIITNTPPNQWCNQGGFTVTYPPGASGLHLVHVYCVIGASAERVELDVSCHTLYLDLQPKRTENNDNCSAGQDIIRQERGFVFRVHMFPFD